MTNLEPKPILHSVRQIQRLTDLSKGTVYGLIRSRELASIKIGKRRLVPAQALDLFIAEKLNPTK